MYLDTLSLTGENALAFLLNNLGHEYSIREIAKAAGQDYKIVFTTVQALAKAKLIELTRVSNINRCKPCLKQENAALFGNISERFAARRLSKRVWNAIQDAVTSIKNPFYALLVFGSHAKGTVRPASDIDVLFIVANETQEREIGPAVRKAATLNNVEINPVILTMEEFIKGLQEESVAREAYKKHFIVKGGELFYTLISHA